MTRLEDLGAWPARVLWVALALMAESCVSDAIDGRSTAVRVVVLAGLWLGWAAGLVALLVPRSSALTGLRIIVPAGAAAMVACTAAGSTTSALDLVAVGVGALAAAAVLMPWVGEAWVDGSSYGPEHRLLLRPPVLFSVILVPVTWAAVVAGATVGPLLLAARQWVPGVLLTALGAGVVYAGVRSLHQLTRRWIVLVPTGMVIHDPITMPEAQLFLRTSIARLGPALASDGDPTSDDAPDDLTGGAPGLALVLQLSENVELLLRTKGRETATKDSTAVLFTPTRPGHLLEIAAERRIPVG